MQKTIIFLGALFFACAVNAQTNDGGNVSDTTHRPGIHRHWNGGGDRGRDGRDGEGGSRMAFREDRMGRGSGRFEGRRRIHYTPEQRKQMQAINTDYRKKSSDLFKNDNQTLGQYKAGLIALQKERKSKLQALLTPQQKEQMEDRKKRASEHAQVMAAARMERLKIHLNLSDQQVATIKSKEADLHTQMKALRDNDNLLPQQKMEKFKELGDQRKDIVKSVLTPDQLSKFNEMGRGRIMHHDDRTMHHDEDGK